MVFDVALYPKREPGVFSGLQFEFRLEPLQYKQSGSKIKPFPFINHGEASSCVKRHYKTVQSVHLSTQTTQMFGLWWAKHAKCLLRE